MDLYLGELGIDLTRNPALRRVQELMAHRHLFAHRSGLINDGYLKNWKDLTGLDLRAEESLRGYPDQDVYWFKPLSSLNEYVEEVRRFFRWFPTSSGDPR